jgi:hypothetical protein
MDSCAHDATHHSVGDATIRDIKKRVAVGEDIRRPNGRNRRLTLRLLDELVNTTRVRSFVSTGRLSLITILPPIFLA